MHENGAEEDSSGDRMELVNPYNIFRRMKIEILAPAVDLSKLEFNHDTVPPNYRKDGPDWFAVFNPRLRRDFDVELVHFFEHTR